MKKAIFTLSLVALFSVAANAQDKSTKTKKEPAAKKEASSSDAATKTEPGAEATKTEEAPVKKSGTRMAINEKGLPSGATKSTKKEAEKK